MKDHYPLKEGRRLLYLYSDAERPDDGSAERLCVAVTGSNGGMAAVWQEAFAGGGRSWERRFEARRTSEAVFEDGVCILRAPLAEGNAWNDGIDEYRIASVRDTVEVEAGRFECVRVEFGNDDTGGGTLWLAKDVGLVKREQYGERGGHSYQLASVEEP